MPERPFGNASWIPEGLKRADLMAIGADFDRLGQEVALLIEMSKRGAMRIQQEVNDSKAVAKDGGGGKGSGGGVEMGGPIASSATGSFA